MHKWKKKISAALVCALMIGSAVHIQAEDVNGSGNDSDANLYAADDTSYVSGELLVMYRQEVPDEQIEYLVETQGGSCVEVISQTEEAAIAVVDVPEEVSVEEALAEYQADERVLAACPNYELELFDSAAAVNDAGFQMQSYIQQIAAQQAWNVLNVAPHSKVRVAVLDTGADITHPDLKNVLNLSLSCEILDSSGTTGPLRGDGYINGAASSGGNGHGTHICGIIAAEANNGQGIAGVGSAVDNSAIDLIAVDVFAKDNTTSLSYLIRGMEYAAKCDAKIINLSLGMEKGSLADEILETVCSNLKNQGILLVCAAGNYGYSDNGSVSVVPADYDSTVSVISVDSVNRKAVDSCYGTLKDISAPGQNIYSTVKGGTYRAMSGTSMAAPSVTAAAAMLCSVKPSLLPDEVKSILQTTATDLGMPGKDAETGSGIVNARRALEAVVPEEVLQPEVPYLDMGKNDWYYGDASYMYQYGIMTGLQPTAFGAGESVKRAQFATILYRLEGEPEIEYREMFPDVPSGQFYTDAVVWAASQGIIRGYDEGFFGPNDMITREQMATLLYRYAEYKGYAVLTEGDYSGYPDAGSVTGFAAEAMQWANGSGIIRGNGDGVLAPQSPANRAECAAMIKRFMAKY